jgi:hypothetical protein
MKKFPLNLDTLHVHSFAIDTFAQPEFLYAPEVGTTSPTVETGSGSQVYTCGFVCVESQGSSC